MVFKLARLLISVCGQSGLESAPPGSGMNGLLLMALRSSYRSDSCGKNGVDSGYGGVNKLHSTLMISILDTDQHGCLLVSTVFNVLMKGCPQGHLWRPSLRPLY